MLLTVTRPKAKHPEQVIVPQELAKVLLNLKDNPETEILLAPSDAPKKLKEVDLRDIVGKAVSSAKIYQTSQLESPRVREENCVHRRLPLNHEAVSQSGGVAVCATSGVSEGHFRTGPSDQGPSQRKVNVQS
eukprot:GHVU01106660.1.p1 GENE.GHVU01106660.1~~GHVU01106660.1.p1  ORF type:complete len:132 (-),score=10.26 GHVU01106660.1:38-433(-)